MKKIIFIAASLIITMIATAQNQTFYDGLIASNSELNGTARFVAVGGAMGALGGDASTVSYNPAGIGVYWIFQNILSTIQMLILNKVYRKEKILAKELVFETVMRRSKENNSKAIAEMNKDK